MTDQIKRNWLKEGVREFIMGFQLISSVALGIFIIAVFYFALQFTDIAIYTEEQVAEAQKIGNWEFPDGSYIMKNFENTSLGDRTFGAVTVKDKKSGNVLTFFDINFSQEEFIKTKDSIQNQLLAKYDLAKFYPKSSGNKTGRIGEEFVYSVVGWNTGNSTKTGIIGSLDCLKNKKNSSIIVFAVNSTAKFNIERALQFINTFDCPASAANGGGDLEIGDKIDTDDDGLTDKVEKMLGSDPFKKDTDGDGYDDFQELQSGYSPMNPRPWDKYTSEEFIKVKKDIKYISVDVYDKLFGGN